MTAVGGASQTTERSVETADNSERELIRETTIYSAQFNNAFCMEVPEPVHLSCRDG